jgi:tRNA (guanine37-N1)-methyltransferase
MRIDVITIFPHLIETAASTGVIGRARTSGLLDVRVHDPRDATADVHRTIDDAPFGGGAGMVMLPEPLFATVERVDPPRPVLLLDPAGDRFDQTMARRLAATDGFTLLCGRYEGVDERVRRHLCDGAVSVGDYVLAGGEVAALVVVEAVGRLVPGVLGNADSAADESFADGLLEYPQYTRPAEFRGMAVPEVLRSGDHARIDRWRRAQALRRTQEVRPDLLAAAGRPDADDLRLLEEFGPE